MVRAVSILVGTGLTLGVADLLCTWCLPAHAELGAPTALLLLPAVLGVLALAGAVAGLVLAGVGGLLLRIAPARLRVWLRPPSRLEGGAAALVATLAYVILAALGPAGPPSTRLLALAVVWAAAALLTAAIAARGGPRSTRDGDETTPPAEAQTLRRPVALATVALVALTGGAAAGLLGLRHEVRIGVFRRAPVAGTLLDLWVGWAGPGDPPRAAVARTGRGAAPPAAAPSGMLSGRSVLLITVESLRGDRTVLGGGHRLVAPVLDLVAARGGAFSKAYAASPSPVAATWSLLTGRYPAQGRFSAAWVGPDDAVRVGEPGPEGGRRLPAVPAQDDAPRLAELLSAEGWWTQAVLCCDWQLSGAGLRRGFARVDDLAYQTRNRSGDGITADVLVRQAVRLLGRAQGRRVFQWVHVPDPSPPFLFHGSTPYFGDEAEDRYDGEVAFVDSQLGVLLDEVERSGLAGDTIVVVAGTQGVSFSPERAGGCGEDVLRVPLMIWLPGVPARRIAAPVEHVDVLPTLLDLLGMPVPPGTAGQSLVPLLLGEARERPRPEVVAEDPPGGPPRRGLVSGPWKLVEDRARGTLELYHLLLDPDERRNRISDGVVDLASLRARLDSYGPDGPPAPVGAPGSGAGEPEG